MSRQRQQQDQNQFSLPFEQEQLPLSPEAAAIIHAHLPPPVLPPLLITRAWPSEIDGVPTPKPLRAAVENKVFGTDENDDPVDPSPEEVLAITRLQGERLTECMQASRELHRRVMNLANPGHDANLRETEKVRCQMQSIVALYAEDFGEDAARHFETWAARCVGEELNGHSSERDSEELQRSDDAKWSENLEPPNLPATEIPTSSRNPPSPTPEIVYDDTAASRPKIKARAVGRGERLDQIHGNIDQALDRLAESLEAGRSDALTNWLTTMGRFHNYSLNNQILIAFQKPDATHVAGFHAWKKFNRLVNKGEKGIMILAPVTRTVAKVEQNDERGERVEKPRRQLVNTKAVYVFDISQTHGEPLPQLARVSGEAAGHLLQLKELITSKGIELHFAERLPHGAQGNSEGGRIGCVSGLTSAEEFRTLAHELAHELLHRGERRESTTRRSRELEAESVAFVVCTAIGLDAKECSTDYIQLYRGDKKMLLESLQFIRQVSAEMISFLKPAESWDENRKH